MPLSLKSRLNKKDLLQDEFFSSYLDTLNIKENDIKSLPQVKEIFKLAVDDFIDKNISIDDLSEFANKLFNIYRENFDIKEDEKLYSVLLSGGELSFYIRKPDQLLDFVDFLKELYKYRQNLDK